MAEDVLLSGGNSAASVVRNGDTVRKPPTLFDEATKVLLDRLDEAGVTGVPKALGTDDQGRRTLSWVPGDTAFPENMWTETATLQTATEHLRAIHDASVPLVTRKADWAYRYPNPAMHQVICHNDFAPYNMTFDATGTVIGVIDFDLAGPGPRSRDLAYLAWWLVPFGQQDPDMDHATIADIEDGSTRLKTLFAAYGIPPDAALLDMVSHALLHMSDPDIAARMIGEDAAARLAEGGHFAHWARAAVDFDVIKPRIAANLG
jgi:hypothetical protein